MSTGTVTKWNISKGWGFIKPYDEEQEVYVHYTSIVGGSRLQEGGEVLFTYDMSEPKTKKEKEFREQGKRAAVNVQGSGVIPATLGSQMGTIFEWNPALGYGFILGTDGVKVYVHESAFDGARLQVGKAVTYDALSIGHKSGRNVAVNVGGSAVCPRGSITGTVKSWLASKGFGFAEAEGREIFVHSSVINNGWLQVGKEIYFEIEQRPVEGSDTPKFAAVGVTGPALRDASQAATPQVPSMLQNLGKNRLMFNRSNFGDEKRKDTDGKYYTKAQFMELYGGTKEWDTRETRRSPLNGKMYTRDQFISHFGGLKEWGQSGRKAVSAPIVLNYMPYSAPARGRGGRKVANKIGRGK